MQHAVVFKFRPHAAPKWAIEEPINFSSFATFHALASIEVSNGIFELQVKSQVANIHLQVGCGLWKTRPESVLPDADSTTWNVAQQALAHAGSWDISEFGDCLEFATNRLVIDCRPVTVRKQLQLTPEGATLNFTSKDSPNSQEHKHNIRINVYTPSQAAQALWNEHAVGRLVIRQRQHPSAEPVSARSDVPAHEGLSYDDGPGLAMHCTAQQLADATLCIGLYNEGKGQYSNRDANFFPVVNRCKNALMLHCAPIMLEVELIGRSQQVLQSFRQKANQTMLPDGRILAYWASSEPSQRCANVKLTEYLRNSFLQAPTESLCLVFRLCLDLPQSQVGHVILARRTFFLQGVQAASQLLSSSASSGSPSPTRELLPKITLIYKRDSGSSGMYQQQIHTQAMSALPLATWHISPLHGHIFQIVMHNDPVPDVANSWMARIGSNPVFDIRRPHVMRASEEVIAVRDYNSTGSFDVDFCLPQYQSVIGQDGHRISLFRGIREHCFVRCLRYTVPEALSETRAFFGPSETEANAEPKKLVISSNQLNDRSFDFGFVTPNNGKFFPISYVYTHALPCSISIDIGHLHAGQKHMKQFTYGATCTRTAHEIQLHWTKDAHGSELRQAFHAYCDVPCLLDWRFSSSHTVRGILNDQQAPVDLGIRMRFLYQGKARLSRFFDVVLQAA